jgi:hypothetical protein
MLFNQGGFVKDKPNNRNRPRPGNQQELIGQNL